VAINELIRAVGLAGIGGSDGCAAADANQNGTIAIDELVRAVRSALDGCDGQAGLSRLGGIEQAFPWSAGSSVPDPLSALRHAACSAGT
jgi:hypothetical protein